MHAIHKIHITFNRPEHISGHYALILIIPIILLIIIITITISNKFKYENAISFFILKHDHFKYQMRMLSYKRAATVAGRAAVYCCV